VERAGSDFYGRRHAGVQADGGVGRFGRRWRRNARRRNARRWRAIDGGAVERKLSFHQTVQLQLRLLFPHGQNVVRAAAGRGETRAGHVGRGGHEEAELLRRRAVRQGRRPVHGRADTVLQDGPPVGRHQRVDSEQRQPDPGDVDAPVRRAGGHAGRVVRLVRRGHEPDDRPATGRPHRSRGQAVRGARVVRPVQDRVQDQHRGERVQRGRGLCRARRPAAAGPVEGVPVPVAGRRERGRGRAPRRRPVLRRRPAVRAVPVAARRRPRHGAREQREHARQLPDPGRVHAVPELSERQEGTVRVAAGRRRQPGARRFRFRRTGVPGTRRRVRVEQTSTPGRPARLVTNANVKCIRVHHIVRNVSNPI